MVKKILAAPYRFLAKYLSGRGLTHIPFFRYLNQKVIGFLKNASSRKIEFRGHILFLDPEDSLNLSFSDYEIYETELIDKELGEGDVFVDIGANLGYHTLTAARKVGEKGKVYAFEPEPKNFALLKKNIIANHYLDRCLLIQKGVSDRTGKKRLYIDPYNYGGHALFDHFEKPEIFLGGRTSEKKDSRNNFIGIEIVALDGFLSENKKVNVIKMDIEGAESLVLEGMIETLKAKKHISVFSEFSPSAMNMLGSDPKKFLETFNNLGFEIFNLNENKKTLAKTSIEEVLKDCTVKNAKTTNLLFRKK